jgi:hypothetical protein
LGRAADDEDEESVPVSDSALGFLQAIYRSPSMKLSVRLRAATEALPFESPKLSAVAVMNGEDFSARLERAIGRSRGGPLLIEHRAEKQRDG